MKRCIDNAAFTVKVNKDILVYKGHGEGDTKWKGWSWKLLLVKLVIIILINLKILQYSISCIFNKASKMNRTSIIILTVFALPLSYRGNNTEKRWFEHLSV